MKTKTKKATPAGEQGFTLIELLIVIAIIGILASVVLVSLNSARTKADGSKVIGMMKSVQTAASMCMTERVDTGYVRINYPTNPASKVICMTVSPITYLTTYPEWPDISSAGWDYYGWCQPGYSGTAAPSDCGSYNNSTCGGNATSGKFCYYVYSGLKRIWCTETGCKSSGF